jgi:DNA-binding response OmpR family regulator
MVVLVIKDWTFRKMLKAQLEEEGFDVQDFESIEEVVNLKGAIIIIDLMDGGYTLDRLKKVKRRVGDMPLLVLRGAAGFSDAQLRKEGFNFILRRPFSVGQLVDEVKNVLNKSFW